jgi:hypothetical protein
MRYIQKTKIKRRGIKASKNDSRNGIHENKLNSQEYENTSLN